MTRTRARGGQAKCARAQLFQMEPALSARVLVHRPDASAFAGARGAGWNGTPQDVRVSSERRDGDRTFELTGSGQSAQAVLVLYVEVCVPPQPTWHGAFLIMHDAGGPGTELRLRRGGVVVASVVLPPGVGLASINSAPPWYVSLSEWSGTVGALADASGPVRFSLARDTVPVYGCTGTGSNTCLQRICVAPPRFAVGLVRGLGGTRHRVLNALASVPRTKLYVARQEASSTAHAFMHGLMHRLARKFKWRKDAGDEDTLDFSVFATLRGDCEDVAMLAGAELEIHAALAGDKDPDTRLRVLHYGFVYGATDPETRTQFAHYTTMVVRTRADGTNAALVYDYEGNEESAVGAFFGTAHDLSRAVADAVARGERPPLFEGPPHTGFDRRGMAAWERALRGHLAERMDYEHAHPRTLLDLSGGALLTWTENDEHPTHARVDDGLCGQALDAVSALSAASVLVTRV